MRSVRGPAACWSEADAASRREKLKGPEVSGAEVEGGDWAQALRSGTRDNSDPKKAGHMVGT